MGGTGFTQGTNNFHVEQAEGLFPSYQQLAIVATHGCKFMCNSEQAIYGFAGNN